MKWYLKTFRAQLKLHQWKDWTEEWLMFNPMIKKKVLLPQLTILPPTPSWLPLRVRKYQKASLSSTSAILSYLTFLECHYDIRVTDVGTLKLHAGANHAAYIAEPKDIVLIKSSALTCMSHRNAVIVRKIIERTHVHIQKKIRQYVAYRNISLLDASDTVRGNRSPPSIASSLDEYPPFPHISANLEDSQLYSSSKSSISSRTRTFYAKAASEYMNSAIKHSSPSRKDVR